MWLAPVVDTKRVASFNARCEASISNVSACQVAPKCCLDCFSVWFQVRATLPPSIAARCHVKSVRKHIKSASRALASAHTTHNTGSAPKPRLTLRTLIECAPASDASRSAASKRKRLSLKTATSESLGHCLLDGFASDTCWPGAKAVKSPNDRYALWRDGPLDARRPLGERIE